MFSDSSITFLTMGALFGLTAGISPGPLLTLVITETLKHDRKEGIKIAVSPLITDLPIILATCFIFSKISVVDPVVGVISIIGGLFFAWLGLETLRTKPLNAEIQVINPESLKRGVTANFLNPNPYVFWFTAGIPTAFKAYEVSLVTVVLYFLLFYAALIGSKILVAFFVEKSKAFLTDKAFRLTMQLLAMVLFVFSAWFLYDGIEKLVP